MSEQYTNCSTCEHWQKGHCQIHQPIDRSTPDCLGYKKSIENVREQEPSYDHWNSGNSKTNRPR